MLVDSFPLIHRIGWKGKVPSISHNAPLIRFNSYTAEIPSSAVYDSVHKQHLLAVQSAILILDQRQCQVESTVLFRNNRLS